MLVSKWQINRIGLIDFWYYDDEEFQFLDGKMLLRGANGSGKSVTMQSFIPLLLDGDKSPNRLDPFGTKARKLENYLLEENDGREERTGYLYMEFKRTESDTYMTVGMGLRARRNKKLDSWYFTITDGKRIGKDFFLYRDLKEKITLSRQELRNRLGDSGEIIEGQREYMRFVNEKLFGYENSEEYKELVDLLIQLRTPKLSKDFKPTILNEILSSSLPPLSEEDLRPMSEAIENMDNLKSKLEALQSGKKAADKINNVYGKYNNIVLYEKALGYEQVCNVFSEKKKDRGRMENKIQQMEKELEENLSLEGHLREEHQTLEIQKADLDKSDVAGIREKQLKLETELENTEKEILKKQETLDKKREREVELNILKKSKTQDKDKAYSNIKCSLGEMDNFVEELSFDEHFFMKEELLEKIGEAFDFRGVKSCSKEFSAKLKAGIELLEEEQIYNREYDRLEKEKDGLQRLKNKSEAEFLQAERQQSEIKAELIENLYKWNKENEQLIMSENDMQYLSGCVNKFTIDSDYRQVVEYVWKLQAEVAGRLQREKIQLDAEADLTNQALLEKETELEEWKEKKEPEPERHSATTRNRQALKDAGIPFYPFYRAVDFAGVTEKQADILEEALLNMGILDALIVPSNYQKKILKMDKGLSDKYLFSDSGALQEGLGKVLCVGDEINDLVLYQELSNLLGNIQHSGNFSESSSRSAKEPITRPSTYINQNGNYGIGVIKGTITGDYKAKYIGIKAREKFKKETIGRLQIELNEIKAKLSELQLALKKNEKAYACLEREFQMFPKGEDLALAVKVCDTLEKKIEAFETQIGTLSQEAVKVKAKASELRIEISSICHKLSLEGKLTVFKEALDMMKDYYEQIIGLENLHKEYLRICDGLLMLGEQIEENLAFMDEVMYDLNVQEKSKRLALSEIQNCNEQLELSNYEQIKEKLDYCVKRLSEIPDELERIAENKGLLKGNIENLREEINSLGSRLQELETNLGLSEIAFWGEFLLGYTNIPTKTENEDMYSFAKRVVKGLETQENKSSVDFLSSLQSQFYANLGELSEYRLFMKDIYPGTELDSSKTRRQAIYGKYQGKQVEFNILLTNLTNDIELQENLVRDSDRELFEDILANTISKKIRSKIYRSEDWVAKMNTLMSNMNTSSGLTLSLMWKKKKAEQEEQLDTRELVELLKKDAKVMHEEEFQKLSMHFHSKIEEARRLLSEKGNDKSFHIIMREVLDYRKWFEFQLHYQKSGENKRELTNNAFFTLSGGEKAMAMYVPLFSAVVAKYQSARSDAPRLISLDEAFAGVDETNIRDMFKLMVELDFEFIINSQILWGDYDTVPNLAIYQLLRPENAKFVTVIPYHWNGMSKIQVL